MLIVLSAEPIQETDAAPANAGKNSERVGDERGRFVENHGVKKQRRPEHAENQLNQKRFHNAASKALILRFKILILSSKLLSAVAALSATLST